LGGTPHGSLVAGPVGFFVDVWSVISLHWHGPIFRAFGRQVTAADNIVPLRATARSAIDVSAVAGKQAASPCLIIGIPNSGF
jgi:hypothetical protein